MPNWCSNNILIKGSPESLARFKETMKDGTFSFQQIVPRPPEEEDNWYAWNCANWGTKWDVGDVDVQIQEDTIYIYCDTAWGPPDAWAKNASKKFNVGIRIDYREPGMELCGTIIATPLSFRNQAREFVEDEAF